MTKKIWKSKLLYSLWIPNSCRRNRHASSLSNQMPQWNTFILLGHVPNNKNSMNVITITNAYQSHAY